ncbi:MAG: HAD family hydrolase [Bacteroidia bacterium]|nr:HAD family hydrolase [Bacteroidia bacterium]MDW8014680.1 HAD family hydrolase [Bacteroidia bacterium]
MAEFDDRWTLFLDRDGVINVERVGGYVLRWADFEFLPGVEAALKVLKSIFGRIIVVTNQRGVGKGLMTHEELQAIHQQMRAHIEAAGGRIDAIYACTDAEDESPCRKPNIGMALQAKRDFPEIDFKYSIMVGNTESDMYFGRALGMRTIWIASRKPSPEPPYLAEAVYASLWEWTQALERGQSKFSLPKSASYSIKD